MYVEIDVIVKIKMREDALEGRVHENMEKNQVLLPKQKDKPFMNMGYLHMVIQKVFIKIGLLTKINIFDLEGLCRGVKVVNTRQTVYELGKG